MNAASADVFNLGDGLTSLELVAVGNVGNDADSTGFGSVSYDYRIGKYEVTNAQYAVFLNAVAASDPNELYNASMGVPDSRGGITRTGVDGGYVYAVKADMANKPVNYVSWYDAARFTNWLHNGQGSGGTESGVYTLTGPTSIDGGRADGAAYFIPTEDEWYKAAYHQPSDQGGDSSDYWDYATASNDLPTGATANATGDIANPGPNVANYNNSANWSTLTGHVTTVGSAGPDSASFYGTFDQSGNLFELNETVVSGVRGVRGGAWLFDGSLLPASARLSISPAAEEHYLGFRIASHLPEPATAVLLIAGFSLGLLRRGVSLRN